MVIVVVRLDTFNHFNVEKGRKINVEKVKKQSDNTVENYHALKFFQCGKRKVEGRTESVKHGGNLLDLKK